MLDGQFRVILWRREILDALWSGRKDKLITLLNLFDAATCVGLLHQAGLKNFLEEIQELLCKE